MPYFQGYHYNDDRMFVLSLQRCTVEEEWEGRRVTVEYVNTENITHWCLLTFRNTPDYPLYNVKLFNNPGDAQQYINNVEHKVPLVGAGGGSPFTDEPPHRYHLWAQANGLKDYDPLKSFNGYPESLKNPRDIIFLPD